MQGRQFLLRRQGEEEATGWTEQGSLGAALHGYGHGVGVPHMH